MKQRTAHNILAWMLLAVFALAQLPFSLLHHHQHNAPCALVADEQNTHSPVKAHFHSYENPECFVCSGYLLKKDYTTTFTVDVIIEEQALPRVFMAAPQPVTQPCVFHSSRAPPFIS